MLVRPHNPIIHPIIQPNDGEDTVDFTLEINSKGEVYVDGELLEVS
jgi:hypothetical protein